MWFADLYNDKVNLNVGKNQYMYNVPECCSMDINEGKIYFLCQNKVYVYSDKVLLHSFFTLDQSSNKIIVDNDIFVSGEDSGCISVYNLNGEVIKNVKFGEHISDFSIFDNFVYAVTYNDNFLCKTDMLKYDRKIMLDATPQKIILKEFLYLLLNDENNSTIKMFNFELQELKSIKFKRQEGNIFSFYNKIIFNGSEYNYILSKKLNILSQKKSTGEFLCEFSDIPIINKKKKVFDVINNIIYPL